FLKTDSSVGSISTRAPDRAEKSITLKIQRAKARSRRARRPVVAHARRRDDRRAPVPPRLSIRLHRADDEPLRAGGDHPADTPARGRLFARRPGQDPQKPEPAGADDRPDGRKGFGAQDAARARAQALRPQSGLRLEADGRYDPKRSRADRENAA